ncbi:MAG: STAS domain-containing protein [Halomonas sp.]|nr:STAS domain-containing protein [Halomonas sp.]
MTILLDGPARLEANGDVLAASGEADFEVAAALASRGCEWLQTQARDARVHLDLSGVDRPSSAALSVMLEWLRCAQRQRLVVGSVRLSPSLYRLTAMAGLDRLLPSDGHAAVLEPH